MSRCARYYSEGGAAGKYNKPGLPDITGKMFGLRRMDQIKNESSTSALDWNAYDMSMAATQAAVSTPSDISFKASRANKTYGASTTVMPASVETPVALYLGRPAEV